MIKYDCYQNLIPKEFLINKRLTVLDSQKCNNFQAQNKIIVKLNKNTTQLIMHLICLLKINNVKLWVGNFYPLLFYSLGVGYSYHPILYLKNIVFTT